jgi:hypothetical protein
MLCSGLVSVETYRCRGDSTSHIRCVTLAGFLPNSLPCSLPRNRHYICLSVNLSHYVYFPYNNWTYTRLVKDVLCNTICYMTRNGSVRNAQLQVSSLLRISKCIFECITSILYFWRLWFKTSKYDVSK